MQSTVRGTLIRGIRTWLMDDGHYQKVLAQMPSDTCAVLEDMSILHGTPVDAKVYIDIHRAILAVYGAQGEDTFRYGAGAVAMAATSTTMKLLMKLGSPMRIASRIPSVWSQYFNEGKLVFKETGPGSFTLTMDTACQVYGKAGCSGTFGWTGAAMRYAGAKNIVVTHEQCVYEHGASNCILSFQW